MRLIPLNRLSPVLTVARLAFALVALGLVLFLAGCATGGPVPAQVNIVSDTYCSVARKVTWDVNDTRETIDEARRHNSRVDKLCPPPAAPKGTAAPAPALS